MVVIESCLTNGQVIDKSEYNWLIKANEHNLF